MSDPTRPPEHGDEPLNPPPPGQPPAYGAPPSATPATLTPDEITWGGAAHWSALVAAAVTLAFLGPLIVLLVKGNQSAYVRRQAVESLNFQLSVLIYAIVSFLLIFVAIGFVLLPLVGLFWLVFTILGSIKATRGEEYRYPATIRMIS